MSDQPEATEIPSFISEEPPMECTASVSFTTPEGKSLLKLEVTGNRGEAQRLIIGAMRSWTDESDRERLLQIIEVCANALKQVLPSFSAGPPPAPVYYRAGDGMPPFHPPPGTAQSAVPPPSDGAAP